MSFLSPLAFALSALVVPLVLLYFLKVRRRERRVSSLLLWTGLKSDLRGSALFQRLQRDPLLLLQILALLALATALARPSVILMGEGARKVAIVLDTSASMKAVDMAPSRFARAQALAVQTVSRLGKGAEVVVIEAGTQPRVLATFSRDHERAAAAIRKSHPRDLPNRLLDAVRTARGLVGDDPSAEIHVFTDGAWTRTAIPEFDDPRLRWVGVGQGGQNVGITGLAIRKAFYGAFDYQAFISFVNSTSSAQDFRFSIELDERKIAERAVKLEPNVRRSVIVPFSHSGGGTVTVRLHTADDLAADNTASAVLPAPRKLLVLLVSPGNLFLEKVLKTDPYVSLEVRTPDQYQGGLADADVVVVDSAPVPKVGGGRFIFVNTVPGDVPLESLGRVDRPAITDWDHNHLVMRHVDLSKVAIEDAHRIRPLTAGRALVESTAGPLIYALEEQDRRAIFVGFDLFKSDFPLRVAFPLIVSNGLRWLHPSGTDQESVQISTGEPIVVPVSHGLETVTITTPGGRRVTVPVARGLASFGDTDEVGIYTVTMPKGEIRLAVNLMDAEKSNITPRGLPNSTSERRAVAAQVPVARELWPIILAIALALLALEGWLYWRRQAGGSLRVPELPSDRLALSIRAVFIVVLCVALARPTVPRWVDRLNVVFLLDASDSVSLAARERAYRFAAEAVKHMRAADCHALIVFGERAVIDQSLEHRPALDRPKATVPGRATNLFQAIQLALATLPGGEANRVIMLTDGQETAGRAVAAAQAAKDTGVNLYYVPAPLTFSQEVVAEGMVVPQEVKFDETFYVKVVAWSRQQTQGRVSLFRDGAFLGSQIVRLSAGKNVFSYRQAIDTSGIHVYQASIEVDGDTIEDNNRTVGTVVVRGRPLVLLADQDPTHASSLVAALRSQSIDVAVVNPTGVPQDMAGLEKYDGVVLSNVSSLKLTHQQMVNIRDYVRDHGGGLMMIGGEDSFGLGGYYRTPIEEALPVTMEVRQKVEIPSLAVVLSIDRSGSMAMSTKEERVTKLDLAKEAAHLVVDLLEERNEVGVQSWDTEFVWDVSLRRATGKDAIHHAIASIKAGGGTDGYPALKDTYRALFDSAALLKHVIFLSDGQMTRSDFQGLIRRMVKDKITVSSVAVGADADAQLMVDIAKWGKGRFYFTETSQSVPRIFTLETQLASKASLIEQPFKPTLTAPAHEAIQDINWKAAPPLGGYVATTLKSTADLVLMSHQEDPILATWRHGLGRAAAFTSDAKAKWGVLWLRWRDFNKFWAQVTRWTLRSGSRSDALMTVTRGDGTGEVLVDAVDAKGEFVNFLDPQLGVVAPNRARTVVDLEQIGPGRYRGRFPASQEGVYLVGMAQRQGDRITGSELTGLVVPYAEELRKLGVDEPALRELTEMTAGGRLDDPRDVFLRARRPSRMAVEIWPWLVGVVTMLLVPEIAVRRLGPHIANWRPRRQRLENRE
jgi:Ca-activated chloride channel homolog